MTMTELKDLVGLKMLDAVDANIVTPEPRHEWDTPEACDTLSFRLDGVVYVAQEDPSDGYRSMMEDLRTLPDGAEMRNVFQPHQVLAVYRDNRGHNSCEILELIDVVTGKVVLEVGTDNSDDYYPSYVASFQPEHLAANATAGKTEAHSHDL